MLKADDGFESGKLVGMFEDLSHNDGLLEEITEVDDKVSWSCSPDMGCVCDSLKSKQK